MEIPLRLGQVLSNLASNAIKFTETGEVIISVNVISREEEKVKLKFSVKDTGVGLSVEQIDKAVSIFFSGRWLYFKKIRWYRAWFGNL